MLTISVDEQVLQSILDAALRQGGLNILNNVGLVWNAMHQAKQPPIPNLPPRAIEALKRAGEKNDSPRS